MNDKSVKKYFSILEDVVSCEMSEFDKLSSKQKVRKTFLDFKRYWGLLVGEGNFARGMVSGERFSHADRWGYQSSKELNALSEEEMVMFLTLVLNESKKQMVSQHDDMGKLLYQSILRRLPQTMSPTCESLRSDIVDVFDNLSKQND